MLNNPTDLKRLRQAIAGAVLFLALLARFPALDVNPGWFRDEGTYFEVARTIWSAGGARLGPLNVTFASPFMTHPPVWFGTAGAWLAVCGASLPMLRFFNALVGLALVWAVYRTLRETAGGWLVPLLGMALAAFHPDAVIFHRMALPYPLLALEAVGALWMLARWERTGREKYFWSGLGLAALAPVTVYYGVIVPVWAGVFCLLSAEKRRRWRAPLALLALLPLGALWVWGWSRWPGFAADWHALLESARAGGFAKTMEHYRDYGSMGAFYVMGLAGCLLARGGWRGAARLTLLPLGLLHMVLRKEDTLIHVVNYPVAALHPFLAIGAALLAGRAGALAATILFRREAGGTGVTADQVPPATNNRWGARLAGGIIVALVVLGGAGLNLRYAATAFPTTLEFAMVGDDEGAYVVAAHVNANLRPGNHVLATESLWWLIEGRATCLPQAMAWEGEQTDFYLYAIERERFAWPPDMGRAQFLIVDRFLRERLQTPPGNPQYLFRERLEELMSEWRPVMEAGDLRVYENPLAR